MRINWKKFILIIIVIALLTMIYWLITDMNVGKSLKNFKTNNHLNR